MSTTCKKKFWARNCDAVFTRACLEEIYWEAAWLSIWRFSLAPADIFAEKRAHCSRRWKASARSRATNRPSLDRRGFGKTRRSSITSRRSPTCRRFWREEWSGTKRRDKAVREG